MREHRLMPAQGEVITQKSTGAPWTLKGRGVFETMRAYDGKIFLLKEHLNRLSRGLKRLNVDGCPASGRIRRYVYWSLKSSELRNARIRLTVWCDKHKKTRLSVIAWPYKPEGFQKYAGGYRVVVSKCKWLPSREQAVKSIDYMPYLKVYRSAQRRGYDEAILVNREGFLAEGSRSNLFIVKDGMLLTPLLSSGCLDGITRRMVIRLAGSLRILIRENNFLPSELTGADEAFLTNSLIEVMPLTRVGNKPVGAGKIGPVTKRLLKAYRGKVLSGNN